MARVRYQLDAFSGEGARRYGGRWNRPGQKALYLADSHATAIAEFHQAYVFPGTLIAADIVSDAIVDLTDGRGGAIDEHVQDAVDAHWLRIAQIDGETPPSWEIADEWMTAGADGALVPSSQNRGGTNLVLWRWGEDGGAEVRLVDPDGDLG